MKRVNSLGKREEAEKKKFSQTNIHNIMKKATLALLAAILCTAAMAQAPEGEPQIPVYPELQKEKSFSMILVPDPQSYTKFAANQPLFELQTAWIAQNIERLNIKAALFTGDMVEQNGKKRLYLHLYPTSIMATRPASNNGWPYRVPSKDWTTACHT